MWPVLRIDDLIGNRIRTLIVFHLCCYSKYKSSKILIVNVVNLACFVMLTFLIQNILQVFCVLYLLYIHLFQSKLLLRRMMHDPCFIIQGVCWTAISKLTLRVYLNEKKKTCWLLYNWNNQNSGPCKNTA